MVAALVQTAASRTSAGGPEGGVEFVPGRRARAARCGARAGRPTGARMVFHREVDRPWPPFRPWPSREPSFRLVRTGIFPSYSPTGDRLVVNDARRAPPTTAFW